MSWNLSHIPWDKFDATKVNASLLAQAKGASLVEANADDYVVYLRAIFKGDDEILADIERWGEEEKLHGAALRKWCEIADPTFDYDAAMAKFNEAYRIELNVTESIRGSRARELVARCVVETGTTTYYSAMRDAAEEPVLKEVCRRIAGDEVRHFNLFLRHLNQRYAASDKLGWGARLKTIWERIGEAEDRELTFAYFAASDANFDPTRFDEYSKRYMSEAFGLYKPKHFQHTVPLLTKAAGLSFKPWVNAQIGRLVHKAFTMKYKPQPFVHTSIH